MEGFVDGASAQDPMHPDGLGDVLQRLLPEILELERNLASHLIQDGLREIDDAGVRQRLEPGRDVDGIAVEITIRDDHVAQIEAHAQHHLPIRGKIFVGGFRRGLKLDRALDGADRAGELHERAIAHQLDDAAPVPLHQGLENILAPGPERAQRLRLIGAHETAVADDVRDKNGCQPALHMLDT